MQISFYRSLKAVALGFMLLGGLVVSLYAEQSIARKAEFKSFKGDSKIFSGEVKITEMFKAADFRPFSGGLVEFSKGARSAWHTHPAGQTLIVVKGKIYTGTRDGVTQIANEGDTILCPPNLEHWHGAGLDESGSHIALTGVKDGKNVEWLEKVSDKDYKKAVKNAK